MIKCTIAISNNKGGSGKTTTAVNLSAALGEKGYRVLLIDLDPQASSTHWYGIKEIKHKGVFSVFVGKRDINDIIHKTELPTISIAPSSQWMIGIEKLLASEVGAEKILSKQIDRLLSQQSWNFIIVDCPPNLGILTVNALTAVEDVIIPVEAHIMSMEGLAQLLKTIELVKARLNPGLTVAGILPCRVDSRNRHSKEVVEKLKSQFGNLVYKTVIKENIRIAEAPSFAKPVTLYAPKSTGASDYRHLAQEILIKKGLGHGQ